MPPEEIPELDAKGLRQFGLTLGAVLALIPGVVLPWIKGWTMLPNYYWIAAGAAIALWSLLAANSIRRLYRGWMRVSTLIGGTINRLILAAVFFLVIFPIGMGMKLANKDPMRRSFDPGASTYRIPSKTAATKHMENPF